MKIIYLITLLVAIKVCAPMPTFATEYLFRPAFNKKLKKLKCVESACSKLKDVRSALKEKILVPKTKLLSTLSAQVDYYLSLLLIQFEDMLIVESIKELDHNTVDMDSIFPQGCISYSTETPMMEELKKLEEKRRVHNKQLIEFMLAKVNERFEEHPVKQPKLSRTAVYVNWPLISGQNLEEWEESGWLIESQEIENHDYVPDPVDEAIRELRTGLENYAKTFNLKIKVYKGKKPLPDVTQEFIQWLDKQPNSIDQKINETNHIECGSKVLPSPHSIAQEGI